MDAFSCSIESRRHLSFISPHRLHFRRCSTTNTSWDRKSSGYAAKQANGCASVSPAQNFFTTNTLATPLMSRIVRSGEWSTSRSPAVIRHGSGSSKRYPARQQQSTSNGRQSRPGSKRTLLQHLFLKGGLKIVQFDTFFSNCR